MKTLVTGAAGFIGFHLCRRLISDGHTVTGVDNLNDYYDPSLKTARLSMLGYRDGVSANEAFKFVRMDIADADAVDNLFEDGGYDVVVNLAAQAGVRYSIENPRAYVKSNVDGFLNILEGCRQYGIKHLVYASSSSVYGLNSKERRADGSCIQPSIWHTDDGAEIFHCIRPVGTTGHVAISFRGRHNVGATDKGVQQR